MGKTIGLGFAVILATAVFGIATAQQKLFNQSCSALSFGATHANGLARPMPTMLVPCHNRIAE